jgi:hypothetical protein
MHDDCRAAGAYCETPLPLSSRLELSQSRKKAIIWGSTFQQRKINIACKNDKK